VPPTQLENAGNNGNFGETGDNDITNSRKHNRTFIKNQHVIRKKRKEYDGRTRTLGGQHITADDLTLTAVDRYAAKHGTNRYLNVNIKNKPKGRAGGKRRKFKHVCGANMRVINRLS